MPERGSELRHEATIDPELSHFSLSSDMKTFRLDIPRFDTERRPEEIWKQKIFCVLSSQFSAMKARRLVIVL